MGRVDLIPRDHGGAALWGPIAIGAGLLALDIGLLVAALILTP
jgi:hypothetical protein